jgi:Tfp pilus assembly protein PilO
MSGNRQIWCGAIGLLVLVAAMARLFIWPGYQDAASIRRELGVLKAKMNSLKDAGVQVKKLEEQVRQVRLEVARKYKSIPQTPDTEDLYRKLSLAVDGVSVMDQSFNTGSAEDVSLGAASELRAMPVKVEMSATFESIFALIRAAESMDKLVRVSSVKVICKRDEKTSDSLPMLNASVGLEAIYDPPPGEEEVK